MASFRCYDNSDVIATLIMTNFHLYLIQLWWQFFQMFVYGDVVYAQLGRYWPWKTVSRHFHMPVRPMLLHRMALVSFRLFCKNLGKWFTVPPGRKLPVRLCIKIMCNWDVWRFSPTKQRCSSAKQRQRKTKSVKHVQICFFLLLIRKKRVCTCNLFFW